MKKIVVLIILFLLMAVSVSAWDWTQYGGGVSSNESNVGIGIFPEYNLVRNDTNDGSVFEPLVADVDNDGEKEIIIGTADGFVRVYDQYFVLKDEVSIRSAPLSQIALTDFDNDGLFEINGVADNTSAKMFFSYEWDGNDFTMICERNSAYANDGLSGVKCVNSSGDVYCVVALTHNAGGIGPDYYHYYYSFNLHDGCNFTTDSDSHSGSLVGGFQRDIAIADLNSDGHFEMIFLSYVSTSAPYADNDIDLVAYSVENMTLFTGFSGDGIVEDIGTCTVSGQGCQLSNVLSVNLDGGDPEVAFVLNGVLRVYNGNGALKFSVGADNLSQPSFSDYDDDGDYDTFVIAKYGDDVRLVILDESGALLVNTSYGGSLINNWGGQGYTLPVMITTADVTNSSVPDVVSYEGIFNFSGDIIHNFSTGQSPCSYVPVDIDSDSLLDLAYSCRDQSYIYWSNVTALLPEAFIGVCEEPCIWFEDFNYSSTFYDQYWYLLPENNSLVPTNLKMFFDNVSDQFISHFYPVTLNPTISLRYFLTVGSLSDVLEFSLIQAQGFSTKAIINFQYSNGGITAKSYTGETYTVCDSCYSANTEQKYVLNIYFDNVADGFYDNASSTFVKYDSNSFVFSIDDDIKGRNLNFFQNVSSTDSVFTNQFHIYKGKGTNFTIDDIKIWKGTSINDTFDNTNIGFIPGIDVENETISGFGFKYSRSDRSNVEFDCQRNPACCGVIRGEVKVKSQFCVMGVVFSEILGNVGEWIMDNMLMFILVIAFLIFLVPMIVWLNRR